MIPLIQKLMSPTPSSPRCGRCATFDKADALRPDLRQACDKDGLAGLCSRPGEERFIHHPNQSCRAFAAAH